MFLEIKQIKKSFGMGDREEAVFIPKKASRIHFSDV